MPTRLTVDFHVHVMGPGYFPPSWHRATARRWAASTVPPRDPSDVLDRIEPGLVDEDASLLFEEYDSIGIDAAVCLTLDWAYALGDTDGATPESMMQNYAHLQERWAGRFYAFAGVDPRRPGGLDLFDRAIREWGLRGLKMYPPCGYFPYEEVCDPFYRRALELDVPVVIHTALDPAYPLRPRFANPLGVGDVQVRFPELTIVLAHSGYPVWAEEAIEVARNHPTSYLELSNWNFLAVNDPKDAVKTLARMRDAVGAHRLLFGSDKIGGPRFAGSRSVVPAWIEFVRSLPELAPRYGHSFTSEEVDLILGGNAVRLLGLEEDSG